MKIVCRIHMQAAYIKENSFMLKGSMFVSDNTLSMYVWHLQINLDRNIKSVDSWTEEES